MIRSEASGFQMQDLSSASSTAMQLISTPGKGGSMSRHSLSRTSRALSSLTSWQSALTPDQSRTRGATSQAYTKHVLPGGMGRLTRSKAGGRHSPASRSARSANSGIGGLASGRSATCAMANEDASENEEADTKVNAVDTQGLCARLPPSFEA